MGKFWQISTELWPLIDVRNIENILWRGMLHACSVFIKVIKLYEFFKISISHILKKIDGHFCYHSNGKSQINTKCLHLVYCSNKLMRRKWRKTIFVF